MKKISNVLFLFCFYSLALIGLFHTGLFSSLVFFYRGLLFIFFTSISLLFSLKKYSFLTRVALVSIFLSIQSMFFVLVPVTIDRSITVFMLREFERAGRDGITELQMENLFIESYVKNNRALQKRYTEQLQSTSIKKTTSGFEITPRGALLVSFFSRVGALYNLK